MAIKRQYFGPWIGDDAPFSTHSHASLARLSRPETVPGRSIVGKNVNALRKSCRIVDEEHDPLDVVFRKYRPMSQTKKSRDQKISQ